MKGRTGGRYAPGGRVREGCALPMRALADMGMVYPGHAVALAIAADIEAFARAWPGHPGLVDNTARERRFTFAPPEIADA